MTTHDQRQAFRQQIKRYGLVSDQVDENELVVILMEAARTNTLAGDVVEFGCYVGTTSLYLARLLEPQVARLYVYDSFEGLPEKTSWDASPAGEQFQKGALSATKKQLITHFKKAGLPLPVIKKAWFYELAAADVPDKIRFAFLDGDYYESVRDPLRLIEDRLVKGAVVVVDDYANESLPGAARAVDEWVKRRGARLRVEQSLAIIMT